MKCPIGAGLRSAHIPHLLTGPQTEANWFEVISENYFDAPPVAMENLLKIRDNYPIALHGVSLNVASFEDLNLDYLHKLKELIDATRPFQISDHLCWSGHAHSNLHNLLPIPYTKENLNFLVRKISKVQDYLEREILIENLSAYFSFVEQDFTEWDFLNELAKLSGCKILLDINNIYVNATNQGFDPYQYLDAISDKYIGEFHLAGFSTRENFLIDTHSKAIHKNVWKLFDYKVKSHPKTPTLIEWDEDIPNFETLDQEVKKAKNIWAKYYE